MGKNRKATQYNNHEVNHLFQYLKRKNLSTLQNWYSVGISYASVLEMIRKNLNEMGHELWNYEDFSRLSYKSKTLTKKMSRNTTCGYY